MTTEAMTAAISDDEIVLRASSLPELDGYPTVDELLERIEALRAEFPDLLTRRRVGTSRLGEPIMAYLVGENAAEEAHTSCLVVGGIHPNEPIGSHTIVRLLDDLLRDASLRERLATVWHVIPCIDPDSMRLNEGWFDDPFDAETYFRNFYRPPGREQVEWTFPIDYKQKYFDAMLPETQALQRVIDEVRPQVYIPLHNSETGGAYYYLSPAGRGLAPLLHRLPAELGIPLHLGEPEVAHLAELAPAVFASGTAEDAYEWRVQNDLDPVPPGAAGQSSTSYASRYGTVSLIAELPIWRTFGADDTRPSGANYADLLREAGESLSETGAQLSALLERVRPFLTLNSPFLRSAEAFVPGMSRAGQHMVERSQDIENDREARVAERPMSVVWMYRLRFGGALLRALRAEVAAGSAPVPVRRATIELDRSWRDWLTQRDVEERPERIPVTDVVGVQYGAVLGLVAQQAARAGRREKKAS
jgi:hypothetical protein